MFGMSMVIQGRRVWTLADGSEMDVEDFKEGRRPESATTEKPVIRIKQLMAVDAVDEPAANRDGLFAARHFGISPSEILFLGDAPYDMQCAAAAGAKGALAVWGTTDPTIPADYYPPTPLDVLAILGLTAD